MGAPVLNGPFVMPMVPQLCAAEDAAVDLSLHWPSLSSCREGCILGALNQMIGSMSLMQRRYPDVYVRQPGGHAIYFPLLFRMKFPL